VSGWAKAEYEQMGLWPGDAHFPRRYDYSTEYVTILRELWETGRSDFTGEYFRMTDCRLSPRPQTQVKIVCAGQSERGMRFGAEHGDYNFTLGAGVNTPTAFAPTNRQMMQAALRTGRDVGTYVLFMVIADETDAAAMAKWRHFNAGADADALAWMSDQAGADKTASENSTAKAMVVPEGAINFNMGTLVGSYASVARMLDEAAGVPGTKGIMLTFDDFLIGMEQFGQRIQPLMATRRDRPC
jgi:pyrimidine oxygenase